MMQSMTLTQLCAPLEAQLIGEDCTIDSVSIDSRAITPGALFLALTGDKFDGHDFVSDVAAMGAVALVTQREVETTLPQLRVADTQVALGRLGAFNRSLFGGVVLAVTGSSGKTSVKNMLHAVFARAGKTIATEANYNNEIGVPLTLLRITPDVEYAVVEMGATRVGDIAWLAQLGRPGVAMVTNVAAAHLDGFGTLENVAQGKGEIYDDLQAGDVAIINADQGWARQWRKRAGDATLVDIGLEAPAAVTARDIQLHGFEGASFTASTPAGDIAIRLALPGRHMVGNALFAIAAGLACELSLTTIRDGLESLAPTEGRQRILRTAAGAVLIDDCYNANPGSVSAAIEMLASCAGPRTLVLGEMLELGERSAAHHAEMGALAHAQGIDRFVGVGEALQPAVAAFGASGQWYASREEAIDGLLGQLSVGETVLVKGSRGAGMEVVLEGLLNATGEGEVQSC